MWNEKVMIILLIAGLIKETFYKMCQYFPKAKIIFEGNVKLDLSSYITKAELKNETGVDASKSAAKSDLASLKAKIDKIDVNKLKTVLVDLSKLIYVVRNVVVKKTAYDKLVKKVNSTDTSGFVSKTKYDIGKSDLENKISDADKKYLILVDLLRKQIIILKLVK